MRLAFTDFIARIIGDTVELLLLFIEKIYEWRKVFDMTDEEYEAYLAANSTAFSSAVELGEVRSKEDVLNAAKPKSAARNTAVKTKPGEDEGNDK
eukprot:5961519-Amphidinium_carterae.3